VATDIDQLVPLVERLTTLVETTPEIVAGERSIALKAAHDEISRIIQIVIGLLEAFVVILIFGLWLLRRMISGLITEMRPASS